MREIESELVRLDFGATLFDVFTQNFLQSPVQQMRRGVVLARELALRTDVQIRPV